MFKDENSPYADLDYDHKGSLAEWAQVSVYLAIAIYLYAFLGCHIFKEQFVYKLVVVFQLIKFGLVAGGILLPTLRAQANAIIHDFENFGDWRAIVLGLILTINLIIAMVLSSYVRRLSYDPLEPCSHSCCCGGSVNRRRRRKNSNRFMLCYRRRNSCGDSWATKATQTGSLTDNPGNCCSELCHEPALLPPKKECDRNKKSKPLAESTCIPSNFSKPDKPCSCFLCRKPWKRKKTCCDHTCR